MITYKMPTNFIVA